ncbi:nitrite reductase large subunit NirB [Williamsia sterculiae]|uniref:assimilatory sulfite reductase (ferredoxin) n=1 Tax=Williamsia sterculiae TaxID=1344003 RepID=A0A1N7FYA4_9NOCA|nr:nitrite reductase large subunit NirB [Williamsia sterculiae]SIS05320.1 assimilatory nitrite reductase (NAD(P)H) large subunit precursor [Williamsia sterculiae]
MVRKTVVVIGHGMVGHRFVQAMRDRDVTGAWRIVVLSEESAPAYDRVALSSYVGAWDRDALALSGNRYDDDTSVELRLGEGAAAVDRDDRRVVTTMGIEIDYDALVFATGSYPFVPPVPGSDAERCFVYRTLDDLDGIRTAAEAAGPGATGVVVGGGLLGLEAANALRLMGVEPHVVEFAPRLMPLQVDTGGGALLADLIGDLGVKVHTGVSTTAIAETDDGLRVTLGDESVLDVSLLVFSAGVRPRDAIAREAGLPVGERGGVLVDQACRTQDPDVYAVGEVAAVDGRCYGLVAPGYSTAEVVADQLTGGSTTFAGADMSTKLKLLGVDVASFGDALAVTERALEIVYSDPVAGTYAKVVVSDDASTLLGGILVGNADAYSLLKPMVGQRIPGDPSALIAPAAGSAEIGLGALPDDTEICSCNGVSKGTICAAICEGAADVATVKEKTCAGTTCGGCLPSLKKLLADAGVAQSSALCEHFSHSRRELFEIVVATGIRRFSELITRYGTGAGCDICKPTVASILASTSSDHILDDDRAALQDTNDHFLANMQKNGSYSVVPRMPGGEVTPEQLIVIGEVARDFGLYTKVTGGQRIDMFGARVEQLPQIWRRLVDAGMESGQAYGKSLRTVKSCVGSSWCRYGVQDSVGMAVTLERRYRGLRSPHKIKFGVSGCARECAEARGKDVGVIATEHGWNLYVAGNGGQRPAHAQLLVSGIDDETLIRYIDRYLMFYIRTADRLQRTAPWLESLDGGLDHLRDVVCDDSLGIGGDLEAAMRAHVDGYRDEWSAVLEDEEKLSRFVSFVNAPETADPTIAFGEESGRKVPVLLGAPSFPGT